MRNTKWIFKNSNYINNDNTLSIDQDILTLLHNRNINNAQEIHDFLNPNLDDISDPFSLKDMELAVDKILNSKNNNEDIWIYGDYDVDGITSTSMCYLALNELGFSPKYYIPLRDEGYGLNCDALQHIKDNNGKIIITVDCGITSIKEVDFANSIDLDMIITDHHEIIDDIPNAMAVINPKRKENKYRFKYLAGVGTAFMLILALFERLGKKEDAYKYLDIVAIGTIADIVPLNEENRIFSKFGLQYLQNSQCIGLNLLIRKIFEDYQSRVFTPYDVGFIIAPIFNAAGRLEDAKNAVELLIEKDYKICNSIIENLIKNNSDRKDLQEKILDISTEIIEKNQLFNKNIIVVADETFHHGVIGIVASKILDKYYKPTIIMEIKKDIGVAVASCRSIEGFNIVEALSAVSHLLEKFGGHSAAAGFTIKIENIKDFETLINKYAEENIDKQNFIKPIKIDKNISPFKISYDFLMKLSQLEPFGANNPSPIFTMDNCKINNVRAIGSYKNHLMFNLIKDDIEIKNCVWFNSEDILEEILDNSDKNFDIAFKLKLEEYKDRYQYKIYIEDIKYNFIKNNYISKYSELYDTTFPIETVIYTRKTLNKTDKLIFSFHQNEVDILLNRNIIASLDPQLSSLLCQLKDKYNYNFEISIKDIILKEEHYNIHIIIQRIKNFKSLALKENEIFLDIKKHLIGELNYNSFQQKILSSLFKKKKNTLAPLNYGRGISTVIKTILLYSNYKEKTLLCITKNNIFNSLLPVSNKYIEGYDYYIWLDIDKNNYVENNALNLVFSNDNFNTFNKIDDNYSIPKNIKIIENNMLEKMAENNHVVFSKKLPNKAKVKLIKNIESYPVVYSNGDISILF